MQPHSHLDVIGRSMVPVASGVRERIGGAIGALIAPAIGAISRFRSARMFHPRGITFAGRSEAIIGGAYANLGAQLDGRVLARCSGALWKKPHERFDVLGIALRFRSHKGPELDANAALGDQDLLFATVRSPWLLALAPLLTDAHDFLRNRFFATSPFAVHDQERVELRLEPVEPIDLEGPRDERLRRAVELGRAVFWLEARKTLTFEWHAVARITLEHEVELDQEALRFDPFRDGAGLVPVGVIHGMRRAVYAASQHARPH